MSEDSNDEPSTSSLLTNIPELLNLASLKTSDEVRQMRKRSLHDASEYLELFDERTSEEWPTQTKEMCRWCMHKFSWFPVGIPMRFDELRSRMVMKGYFCSFACAMSFAQDKLSSGVEKPHVAWLSTLAKRCFGLEHLRPAPPRELLNSVSIDEFRSLSAEAEYSSVYNAHFFVREPEFYEKKTDNVPVDADELNATKRAKATSGGVSTYKPLPKGLKPPPSLSDLETRQKSKGILSMLGAKAK